VIINTDNFEYRISADSHFGLENPGIIFLHGFTGSRHTWAHLRDALEYPSAALDLPGHGETKTLEPAVPADFHKLTEELILIFDGLKAGKVHLCGYSMGGRLALAFALSHPERVESVILESASPGLAEADARASRRAADAGLAEKIMTDFEGFLRDWEAMSFFAGQKLRNPGGWQRTQEIRRKSSPAGLAYALKHFGTGAQPSCWDQLAGLELPVLLITGAEDEKFNRIAREMTGRLPYSNHVQIENSGHAPHIDQPENFRLLLSDWLTDAHRLCGVRPR